MRYERLQHAIGALAGLQMRSPKGPIAGVGNR